MVRDQRVGGAVPPLPQYAFWRGVQLGGGQGHSLVSIFTELPWLQVAARTGGISQSSLFFFNSSSSELKYCWNTAILLKIKISFCSLMALVESIDDHQS
jgi:hypothetical protein